MSESDTIMDTYKVQRKEGMLMIMWIKLGEDMEHNASYATRMENVRFFS